MFKWREHQALADQSLSNFAVRMRNELWRIIYFDQYFHHLVCFFLLYNITIISINYQGKVVLILIPNTVRLNNSLWYKLLDHAFNK